MKSTWKLLLGFTLITPLCSTVAEEKTGGSPQLILPGSPSGYVEFQRLSMPAGTQLQLNIAHEFNETFGVFAYGQVHRNWGQTYAGPTFSPTSWLKLGSGVGLEDIGHSTPIRFGGFLWAGNETEKDSLFAVGDFGHSGYWWKVETNHKFSDWFGTGLFAQRDAGIGPRLQFTLPKKPIMFWIAPAYFWETGKPRVVCGLRLSF